MCKSPSRRSRFCRHRNSPTALGASTLECYDTIDFDVEWSRPRWHMQEDAGRGVSRNIAGIDVVEDAEMRFVRRAVDVALQHAIQGRTGSFKAKPHLLQNQLRLSCEWHPLDLAGLRIERRQARHINGFTRHDHRIDRPLAAAFEICRNRLDADWRAFHLGLQVGLHFCRTVRSCRARTLRPVPNCHWLPSLRSWR